MMKNRGRFVRTRSKHSTANAGYRGSPSLSAALIKVSSVKVLVNATGPTDWCVDVTPAVTGEGAKKERKDIALLLLPRDARVLAECADWTDRNSTGFPRSTGRHFFHLLLSVSVKVNTLQWYLLCS